jgi:hypothetical protein
VARQLESQLESQPHRPQISDAAQALQRAKARGTPRGSRAYGYAWGEPSRGADVSGVGPLPSPGADVSGVSPVPVQM